MSQCGRQSSWLTNSADHLVRLVEEQRRQREAEDLGSLEVDDELEFCRLLHGQIRRFGTLQDSVDIIGSAPVQGGNARPIGHEAPTATSCLRAYMAGRRCWLRLTICLM